ncbi:MAG: hypothetical protein ACI4TC_02210 [Kiritimatiellia bacterium]
MVTATVSVDRAALDEITGMLDKFGKDFPGRVGVMTRKVGLSLCDSLRARTKKAPKKARSSEIFAEPSQEKPKYITYRPQGKKWARPGHRLPFDIHRWSFAKRVGTPGVRVAQVFVYARLRHTKRGDIVKDLAAEKAELLRQKGQNFHAGLAKASWGWVKREIFSGASEDASWKRRKNDRRDPTKAVDGAFAETRSGNKSAAAVSIENRLDYICDALPEDAQRAAIEAAQRDLAWRIENDTKRFLG